MAVKLDEQVALEALQVFQIDRGGQAELVAEVVVEAAHAHAGRGQDVFHPGRGDTPVEEQLDRRGRDVLAARAGPGPMARAGSGGPGHSGRSYPGEKNPRYLC